MELRYRHTVPYRIGKKQTQATPEFGPSNPGLRQSHTVRFTGRNFIWMRLRKIRFGSNNTPFMSSFKQRKRKLTAKYLRGSMIGHLRILVDSILHAGAWRSRKTLLAPLSIRLCRMGYEEGGSIIVNHPSTSVPIPSFPRRMKKRWTDSA
jgi:hypothetical protein